MFNKLHKITHNKYSKYFRFIFSIRYLFLVFFISTVSFLLIPNFFNYEKKLMFIQKFLYENYDFKINSYEDLKFHSFPIPKLEIKNAQINFQDSLKLNIKNLKIYPKIISLYDYKNFQANKIILENNNIILKTSDIISFTKIYLNKKKKLVVKNLNIDLIDKNEIILSLKNLSFSNYGYNKDLIKGKVFENKFKTRISKNFDNLEFELIKSGIKFDISLDEKKTKPTSGVFKSKILNTNLKFNFNYENKILDINNLFFRNKDLSFNGESKVTFYPFLYLTSKINVEDINVKIFKNFDIFKVFQFKKVLKKINTKNEIIFNSKKITKNKSDNINLNFDLAYGNLNYVKSFSIPDGFFKCSGFINFMQEYPLLNFDCLIETKDENKLLRKFNIKRKKKNGLLIVNFEGNLGLLNKKINFKKISANKKYIASREDLKYFNETFTKIFLDESFIKIFSKKKIKKFISEIY